MATRDPDAPVRRVLDVVLAALLVLTAFTWWKAYGEPQPQPGAVFTSAAMERPASAAPSTAG
jgi:hypothetical protein